MTWVCAPCYSPRYKYYRSPSTDYHRFFSLLRMVIIITDLKYIWNLDCKQFMIHAFPSWFVWIPCFSPLWKIQNPRVVDLRIFWSPPFIHFCISLFPLHKKFLGDFLGDFRVIYIFFSSLLHRIPLHHGAMWMKSTFLRMHEEWSTSFPKCTLLLRVLGKE